MSTSPDVNRLSLEERIVALENRLQAGNGTSLSGISFMSGDDIDRAGSNTFTRVEGGWICKIDIPNTSNLQENNTYGGLRIRCAMLIPQVVGLLLAPRQVVFVAERVANLSLVYDRLYGYSHSWTIDNQELLGTLDGALWAFQDSGFRFGERRSDNYAYVFNTGLVTSINNTGYAQKFAIGANVRNTTTGTHTLVPSRMVGVFMLPTAFPNFNGRSYALMYCGGAPNLASSETVDPGQQFSARFHAFLPQSWR